MFPVNVVTGLIIGLALLASAPKDLEGGHLEPLSIETAGGALNFRVEIATTPKEQARGLMYRKSMDPDHGMLFTLKQPRQVSFWMKNTYIPLDMLFLGPDGKILQIEENTVPLTEMSHRSRMKISGILEINGGLSKELGIQEGDIVYHGFFSNIEACADTSSHTSSHRPCQ